MLKSKHSLYKKSKTAMRKLKTTTKLLTPQIVLPRPFQPIHLMRQNTIHNVHTSLPTTPLKIPSVSLMKTQSSASSTKTKKKLSIKKLFSRKDRKNTDDNGTPVASRTRSRKATSVTPQKLLEKALVLERTGSDITEATTNPNTPVRGGDNPTETTTNPDTPARISDDETEATTVPNTPIRGSDVPTNDDIETDDVADKHSILCTSFSMESSASGTGTTKSPYIFADDDDENEQKTQEESKEPRTLDAGPGVDAAGIYNLLEKELNSLEDRLRKQKEERRAMAEGKLETEEKDDTETNSAMDDAVEIDTPNEDSPDERRKQKTGFISRVSVLFPAVLFLIHWIRLRVLVATPSYDHAKSLEKAQVFFGATTGGLRGMATEASATPMDGIHVVLSENDSKLGSTIRDRFVRLGATVASVDDEGIDCTDLDSVAKSVDSVVEKLNHKIDFLIHTGNLCLGGGVGGIGNTVESVASESVQGYDVLFAGNYLSSFLVTQKTLSHLEQSRFGTVVQFSSPISTLVDGSKLKIVDSSDAGGRPEASALLQQQSSHLSTMLRLPLGFAYAKLSEILQHKVISRIYPNIRTIEVTTGWTSGLMYGEGSANDFFDQVFRKEEGEEFLPSSTSVTTSIVAENEDLQNDLYEWSQTAVWNWISPPAQPPIAEKIMGTHLIAGNADEENSSAVASSLFPASTAAMVTSSTLALLAVKVKNLAWDSNGNTWLSSE